MNVQLWQPQRGREPDLGRAELGPPRQHQLALLQVGARPVEVAARRIVRGHHDLTVERLGFLEHDHGVGAPGQHAAGQDPGRRARRELPLVRPARRGLPHHPKPAAPVGRADRVAVDGAGGKGWQLPVRPQVLGQDPPWTLAERDGLRAQDGRAREHQPRRLVGGDQRVGRGLHLKRSLGSSVEAPGS